MCTLSPKLFFLYTIKLIPAYDRRMTFNHFVRRSLAGIRNPLFHHGVVAERLDENNLTAVFFITEHHIDGSITPL